MKVNTLVAKNKNDVNVSDLMSKLSDNPDHGQSYF